MTGIWEYAPLSENNHRTIADPWNCRLGDSSWIVDISIQIFARIRRRRRPGVAKLPPQTTRKIIDGIALMRLTSPLIWSRRFLPVFRPRYLFLPRPLTENNFPFPITSTTRTHRQHLPGRERGAGAAAAVRGRICVTGRERPWRRCDEGEAARYRSALLLRASRPPSPPPTCPLPRLRRGPRPRRRAVPASLSVPRSRCGAVELIQIEYSASVLFCFMMRAGVLPGVGLYLCQKNPLLLFLIFFLVVLLPSPLFTFPHTYTHITHTLVVVNYSFCTRSQNV